ncbi:MAG: transcriptional regulator [Microvirga sp.]|jgi:transcriptional regulator with XRE-family HTH domain|nr:transcriptional regulator [Microvirga sp.]
MITPAQSRAARALLEWSQSDLAEAANLSESTIRDFEKGRRLPALASLAQIYTAIEKAGVEVLKEHAPFAGEGARFIYRADRSELQRLRLEVATIRRMEDIVQKDLDLDPDNDLVRDIYEFTVERRVEAESRLAEEEAAQKALEESDE